MTHFDDLADAMYEGDLSLQEANRISRQRDREAKYSGEGLSRLVVKDEQGEVVEP